MIKSCTLYFFILLGLFSSNNNHVFHKFNTTYVVNKVSDKTRTISVGLSFTKLHKYRELKPNTIYNEVLSYSKEKPFGDNHGRSTNVHETVHGINSYVRNTYKAELKKNINGFYAGNGNAIIVENPKLTMRDIIPNIPLVLRGYRYELYFVKQLGDWNDTPTYPIDEWTAYIAGAECAVDDDKNGIKIPKSDYVSGALEFSIYCVALAKTVKDKDPEYWNNNEQFRNAIKYYLIKAEKVFFAGCEIFPFEQQDILLKELRDNEDAKILKEFLLKEFEGIFVD